MTPRARLGRVVWAILGRSPRSPSIPLDLNPVRVGGAEGRPAKVAQQQGSQGVVASETQRWERYALGARGGGQLFSEGRENTGGFVITPPPSLALPVCEAGLWLASGVVWYPSLQGVRGWAVWGSLGFCSLWGRGGDVGGSRSWPVGWFGGRDPGLGRGFRPRQKKSKKC